MVIRMKLIVLLISNFEKGATMNEKDLWQCRTKADKDKIKRYYLKFYKEFDCLTCPCLLAQSALGQDAGEGLFWVGADGLCRMCRSWAVLTKNKGTSCPCNEYGPEEAKKRLAKLLRVWGLLK